MKIEIKIPAMGESITEATIGTILIQEGVSVNADDEILELETDKVNQVLFAPESGTLHLTVKSEDVVEIGQVIGHIETEGAKPVQKPAPEKKEEVKTPPPPTGEKLRVKKEEHFEKKAPAPKKPQQVREEVRKKMPKIRQIIAKRLLEAKQSTAMLTTFNEVDLTEVIKIRAEHKESFEKEHGVKLGFMSFFVKATLSALEAVPQLNFSIDGDEIIERHYFDIGIAVSTERGLIVPVLRDCDKMSFDEIEKGITQYATAAKTGTLSADDLMGGGFTITNGGIFGSLLSTPILNPPQSGILGMHKIQKRPIAVNDEVVIAPMMYLALSYDHRLIDGKEAVAFLVHLKNCLEDPAKLLLDT
jgi:2-oxoglutarate dehydrogenase E2 component (dihydrolipoamide succinyltransferase)